MSLKTFLNKIWHAVEHLFNGLLPELKAAIHVGVTIVENLKSFADGPGADILTAIIPGDLDDKIKAKLRQELPKILVSLKLAEQCSDLTDPAEITACAVKTLQSIEGDFKSSFLHSLSILIAQVAADGKLTWSDGASILEWYYQNKK